MVVPRSLSPFGIARHGPAARPRASAASGPPRRGAGPSPGASQAGSTIPEKACGHPCPDFIGRDIVRDDAPGADDGPLPDAHPRQEDAANTEIPAVLHFDWGEGEGIAGH